MTARTESPIRIILDAMLAGEFLYLMSFALLTEYRQVLLRPQIRRYHRRTEAEVDELLADIVAHAAFREVAAVPPAPDPKDTHLWQLLAAQPGAVLVTGDRLLFDQPPQATEVFSPADFVARYLSGPRTPKKKSRGG